MTEAELEQTFPEIPWREPLPVTTPGASGLACRFCIALYGLKGSNVGRLPQTAEEFAEHMEALHR